MRRASLPVSSCSWDDPQLVVESEVDLEDERAALRTDQLGRAELEDTDCNPAGGGFCCIPGSHKANVSLPDKYRNLDEYIDENVRAIGCKAGDCIIFTEALSAPLCLQQLCPAFAPGGVLTD